MNKKIALLLVSTILIFASCKTTEQKKTPQEMLREGLIESAKGEFTFSSDIHAVDNEGNTVLHVAAEIDNAELIDYFIARGADPDVKNSNGDTALLVAIKKDSFNVVKKLATIKGGIFAKDSEGIPAIEVALNKNERYYDFLITKETGNILNSFGQNLVHYFVESKNLKGIELCIEKELPISIKDSNNKTPLDLAFSDINDIICVEIAAKLIEGNAEEVITDFSYFQEAIRNRNVNIRFEDGQTPLHLSAIFGHNAIAEYLLGNGADTSVQDSAGSTPLHEAIRYGNIDVTKLLLASNANVNAEDTLGKTPIMLTMPKDKIKDSYETLIKYKADLHQKDKFGDTVLHTATMLQVEDEILLMLTENGADINARNKEGVTPLLIAIQSGDVEMTRLLTSCGANIHTKDTHGNSPLSIALSSDTEIFEATVNQQNCNTQDSNGNTPLHIALINDAPLLKVQHIISLTDDVNLRNSEGNSPLFITVLKNRKQVGTTLLQKNADIFSTNTNNNSPLSLALKYGGSVQDWLITSKTIHSTDGSGNTVLHYAAEWGYIDSIISLNSKGADINARNANGESCLFNAAKTDNPEVIQTVINQGAGIFERDNLGNTPLHTAVRWDAKNAAEKLLELGININSQNSAGKSPLAEAVIAGKEKVAEFLLENGADVNSSDTTGVTILMDTIRGQNPNLVELLLAYDANPNLQDIYGQNAYHYAAYIANIDIINLISWAGGNPLSRDKQGKTPFSIVINKNIDIAKAVLGNSWNITDSDGNSPIHIIVKNNASDVLLKTLINEGYPIDTRNADGYTPLNYAIQANDIDTALILLENGANPFHTIDKKGTNGITLALDNKNRTMITNIVKYSNETSDIKGNTILHYAARIPDEKIFADLLSFGLDTDLKNISGDTAFDIAKRWKNTKIMDLIKQNNQNKKNNE